MKLIQRMILCFAMSITTFAQAEMLSYSFVDGIGDQSRTGYSDLSKISVLFDNNTGDYVITLFSTAEKPFEGWLSVNANMVNPDTPSFVMSQSYFFDNLHKITLSSSTSSVTLVGNSPSLMWWKEGDRVATSSALFGIANDAPPSSFSSALNQGLIYTEWSTDEFPNNQIATITAVPEPENVVLFVVGILAIASIRRKSSLNNQKKQ